MNIEDIKDTNLKSYLSGSINLSDLQSRMKGFEPYSIIDGKIVVLSDTEYMKKINGSTASKKKSIIKTEDGFDMCVSDEEKQYVRETPDKIDQYKKLIPSLNPSKNMLDSMLLIIPTYGSYDILRHRALLSTIISLVSIQNYLPELVLIEASENRTYPELENLPWLRYEHVIIDERNYGGLFQKESLIEYMIRKSYHERLVWIDGDLTCDDPEWMFKLYRELDSNQNALVQCFEWFCDPLAGRGEGVSLGKDKRESEKYWTNPGLAWSCNRSYINKCPQPFLNPMAITGSGDMLFVHEHYSKEVYKHQQEFDYYNNIIRSGIPKADVSCARVRLTHVYHGHYNFRAYYWSQKAIDFFGSLSKFVCLDERGLLKWITPDNPLRSCMKQRRHMTSEDKVLSMVKSSKDEYPTLISPQHQKVIQIDITNVCSKKCSNCTRFCGHHKDQFFMTFDQFKGAVDSLQGYQGIVGIMGGEPTLHPLFEEFTRYLEEKRPDTSRGLSQYDFLTNFSKCHEKVKNFGDWKVGLWTCLGSGYKKHYETIQRVYRYQCINDHLGGSSHVALLLPRKELGISDEEWLRYRNRCWVQKLWSATVTPKGAFFCEVAAALSYLFNESDGIAVEPGWWKKEPEEFGDQLRLCEYCSACLPVPSNIDSDETDQVSPEIYERLKSYGSKKSMEIVTDDWKNLKSKYSANSSCAPYLEASDGLRIHEPTGLEAGDVTCIIVCRGYDDFLKMSLPATVREFKNVIVITSEDDIRTQKVAEQHGAKCHISSYVKTDFVKGAAINEVLMTLPNKWIILLDADIIIPFGIGEMLKTSIMNPGALYYAERRGPFFDDFRLNTGLATIATRERAWDVLWETLGDRVYVQKAPWGFFQVFNTGSSVLKGKKSLYPMESNSAESDDAIFCNEWYGKDRCVFLPQPMSTVLHLSHGNSRINWTGRTSIRTDVDDRWWVHDDTLRWRINYRAGRAFIGLLNLVKSLKLPDGSIVVEIGSMMGDGAIIWALTYPNIRVISVDIWDIDKVYSEAIYRTSSLKNIELWKMTSLEAKEKCRIENIVPSVVYIDGDHSENGVMSDINAWKSMLAKGGILCGHDYGDVWPEIVRAVDGLLGKPTALFEDSSWIGFVNL